MKEFIVLVQDSLRFIEFLTVIRFALKLVESVAIVQGFIFTSTITLKNCNPGELCALYFDRQVSHGLQAISFEGTS